MKRIFTLMFALATAASALWAQEAEFPHDIFDPAGIPPIPGAKCVGVERFEREIPYNTWLRFYTLNPLVTEPPSNPCRKTKKYPPAIGGNTVTEACNTSATSPSTST